MQIISRYYKLSLANRILIWMAIGTIIGIVAGEKILFLKPVGEVFLDLLIMAAIPLVFFNLLSGLSGIGSIKSFGIIGVRTILYYLSTTTVAIILGITVMSVTKAGAGMNFNGEIPEKLGEVPPLGEMFRDMIPSNIFQSFVEGNLIQIVLIAVLLGIVILQFPEEKKQKISSGVDLITQMMLSLVDLILKASPLGLGALMAVTFAESGGEVALSLTYFMLSIYLAQLCMIGFYMLVLYFVGRISPVWFLSRTLSLYATTVATCSSLASLAVSLEIAGEKLKLPSKIYSFTLPLGAQFNKDGTSIMLAGIMIFTAQAVGLELSFLQLVQIVVVGLLLSEGSMGIPGGGLVIAMIFAKAFHLPLEIVAVVGGIYRLIDMGITTVNCMGDMVATSIISRYQNGWRPAYDHEKSQ